MDLTVDLEDDGTIPIKYTCDGEDVSPPLEISEIPPETKTLAIIIEDNDTPRNFVHWIMFNIPVTTSSLLLGENSHLGPEGVNGKGETSYMGPCPSKGEKHKYFFKVYALDAYLDSSTGVTREDLEEIMGKHIIDTAQVIGVYQR